MITYDRLWEIMNEKNITTDALIHKYGISASQISRWKHGEDMKLSTLNKLCSILDCEPSDILSYTHDKISSVVLRDREIMFVSEQDTPKSQPVNEGSRTHSERPQHQLAANLKRLLEEKDMTPRELSVLSGVPLPTIRNIQYARTKNSRTDTLSAIADAFGVSIEELME